jgi:hypothetical protein
MSRKKVKQDEQNHNDNLIRPEDSRIKLIQLLIPIGLEAVKDLLIQEVTALAGDRYAHHEGHLKRWGSNPGSVYIGDQKLEIKVPRIRNTTINKEVPLKSYEELQNPSLIDEKALNLLINGISTRKYENVVEKIPESKLGLKRVLTMTCQSPIFNQPKEIHMSEEKNDQNLFLKKRLNVCRTSTGRLYQIPDDLVIDIVKAWERWPGTAKSFYQSLGIKKEQLGCIMKKGKRLFKEGKEKLGPFVPVDIKNPAAINTNQKDPIILSLDKKKTIRFYQVGQLVEFLKKCA